MKRQRRRSFGIAAVEFALTGPVLLLLAVGVADLGTGVADSSFISGQVRAGVRSVEKAISNDAGTIIRTEGGSSASNTAATWGQAASGYTDDCDPTQPSHTCGDPGGCTIGSAFWITPAVGGGPLPIQCFAVTSCTVVAGPPPTCTLPTGSGASLWGTRLAAGSPSSTLIVVRVAKKFTPMTPLISSLMSNGYVITSRDGYAAPEY